MADPKIYGFTLIRNGIKYDYCFEESLTSLSSVSEKVYVAVGESEDGTEKVVGEMGFVESIPTVWDDSLREGGLILSQQTNVALDGLRADKAHEDSAWGIYLQCDEVFHQDDYDLIMEDIAKAEAAGCDVMTFRYLHFWQSHHQIAINKKWYPQEIRAVRLNSKIESWGDAQSFKNYKKPYHSDARIYHYGHVREEEKYKSKKADILRLYHKDEKLRKYKRREKRFDDQTETLWYFGAHPLLMKKRIEALGEKFFPEKVEKAYLVGEVHNLSEKFLSSILAEKVFIERRVGQVPKADRKLAVLLNPGFFERLFYPSHVPSQMRSKLALPWQEEFITLLKLSEKGIGANV